MSDASPQPPRSYEEAHEHAQPPNRYGPSHTFVGVPRAKLDDAESWTGAQAVIVGAPFDAGTSWRPGARFGPQAIRATDYLPQSGYRPHLALGVDPLHALGVVDAGDVYMPQLDSEGGLQRLMDACEQVAAGGAIPIVLGGDHTITYATASGVARHHGLGRIALIHFDAHADTGDSEGGLWGHGTPMRRLILSGAVRGDRFLQIGLRGYWPDPPLLEWMAEQGMRWYEMSEVVQRGLDECLTEALERAADTGDSEGGLWGHGTPMRRLILSGAVRGDRFLQIGLRGYWPDPPLLEWMAEQGMRWYEMSEVVQRGLDECLMEALERAADDCDGVFLSVDVDVVDPGMAPGTGTPESGGLTSRQLLDAVRRIAIEAPLLGVDVVEVAPAYDQSDVTALLGNRVVLEALSGIAVRRRGASA